MTEQKVERRRAIRSPVRLPARIAFGNSSFDCQILNLSATGAKLKISAHLETGSNVRLYIPADRTVVPAQVMWMDDGNAGLQFTGPFVRVAKSNRMAEIQREWIGTSVRRR